MLWQAQALCAVERGLQLGDGVSMAMDTRIAVCVFAVTAARNRLGKNLQISPESTHNCLQLLPSQAAVFCVQNSRRELGRQRAQRLDRRMLVRYTRRMLLTILPKDAAQLIQAGTVDVIDVRERHEWVTGHIPGARHVPLSRFRQSPKAHLSREATIFVCAAGARSQLAAQLATACGCERAYNLTGGTRAWLAAGLELRVPSEQPAQAAV